VGKSTLMNQLLGQKIANLSPKPQTTRNQLMGILTLPNSDYPDLAAQVIFLDTPGLHHPLHKLGEYLVETVHDTLLQAEVIIWVADATRPPGAEEQQVASAIAAAQARRQRDGGSTVFVILALNKIDLIEPEQLSQLLNRCWPCTPR
jgi:GTP-binding protein Era